MEEMFKILIGIVVLALGWGIGNLLAYMTKEELKVGKKYFKLIIYVSLIIGLAGLVVRNDWLMFTMFFIAIVTSRSLRK
jgi:hypothetical protein